MLLDTSFLLDLLDGHDDAHAKADEIDASGESRYLSAATVYELEYGVQKSNRPDDERAQVSRLLRSYPVLAADAHVMHHAAGIDVELEDAGQALDDLLDVVIGATAATNDEPVLTRNVDHFERMPGVDVATY